MEVRRILIVIAYDVNTETPAGRRRLRHVAKQCVNYGQRVQNSVFECNLEASQYIAFKHKLGSIIDLETDSLRFYLLGNAYQNKIEHLGSKAGYDPEGVLIV